MSVKKDPTVAFIWVAIAIVVLWRTVRIMRGEFSQKERLGGFKPTCYTQTFVKVAKQENNMSPKKVKKPEGFKKQDIRKGGVSALGPNER